VGEEGEKHFFRKRKSYSASKQLAGSLKSFPNNEGVLYGKTVLGM
jgi:hypothetical protein